MTEVLNRTSVVIGETTGRTLSGLAMPWDTVAMVRDLLGGRVGPRYPEAFAPASTDKTRSGHHNFPVFVGHNPASEPIGVVNFNRSHEGLMFDAPLSKTPRADTFLELANDGAMRSVSIQFVPMRHLSRTLAGVPGVTYRTEVGLRHLALAPTGYGQYEDAQVLTIRDNVTFDTKTDAVRDAIEKSIGSSGLPDDPYVGIRDITDTWVVYTIEGGALDLANTQRTMFRCDYTVNADTGDVTLSEPVAVDVSYVPTGRADLERAERLERLSAVRLPELDERAARLRNLTLPELA